MPHHYLKTYFKWILAGLFCAFCVFKSAASFAENNPVIRLAVVNTPVYSGLMDYLLKDFEKETGYRVEIYQGDDVYDVALKGKTDIVISHFGKNELSSFVEGGHGLWPVTIFSNQAVIIGPANDPANIKNLSSATEAFKHIAQAGSPYILNQIPGTDYLTSILMNGAVWPQEAEWIIDDSVAKAEAVKLAEQKQGYTIWGALPFLKFKNKTKSTMDILVSADPILQRVMSAVLVNPDKFKDINHQGAEALQDYLLKPKTQAKIAAYQTPGSDQQLWWPAGRHN